MLSRGRDGPHQWYETARRCRFAHTGQLYPAPADGPIRPGAYQRYAQPRAAGAHASQGRAAQWQIGRPSLVFSGVPNASSQHPPPDYKGDYAT
jgi:hypothetical protein